MISSVYFISVPGSSNIEIGNIDQNDEERNNNDVDIRDSFEDSVDHQIPSSSTNTTQDSVTESATETARLEIFSALYSIQKFTFLFTF